MPGEREWHAKQRIEPILSKDPIFDKSCRYYSRLITQSAVTGLSLQLNHRSFLTRTQMYHRALAMSNRLRELKELHRWSPEEAAIAFKLVDEPMPDALHVAGMHLSSNVASGTDFRSSFSVRACDTVTRLARVEAEVQRAHRQAWHPRASTQFHVHMSCQ